MPYTKNPHLFSQRMAYTLNGITWWATPCCYCGDPAETNDHVFPESAFKKLKATDDLAVPVEMLRLVPACMECNTLGADYVFPSYEAKRLYIKKALERRYQQALQYPGWSKPELEELEGTFRGWIESGEGFRELIFERLRF